MRGLVLSITVFVFGMVASASAEGADRAHDYTNAR